MSRIDELRDLANMWDARWQENPCGASADAMSAAGALKEALCLHEAAITERDLAREEVARLRGELGDVISAAESAIPEGEHPQHKTASNWAWQIRSLGEDRRATYRLLRAAYRSLAEARAALAEKGG